MSYMRAPLYAWSSGPFLHLWARPDEKDCYPDPVEPDDYAMAGGLAIRTEVFDALVLMRYAELLEHPKAMKKALKRLRKQHGNVGTYAFREAIGEDPTDVLRAAVEKSKAAKDPA